MVILIVCAFFKALLLCSLFLKTDKCTVSFSLLCLVCGLNPGARTQEFLCSLFICEGRLSRLVPLSSDNVEAAHGKHPRKRYSAPLSRFMNTERHCRDQTERMHREKRRAVDTSRRAVVSLLPCNDGEYRNEN